MSTTTASVKLNALYHYRCFRAWSGALVVKLATNRQGHLVRACVPIVPAFSNRRSHVQSSEANFHMNTECGGSNALSIDGTRRIMAYVEQDQGGGCGSEHKTNTINEMYAKMRE